ncbi:hypothetical protein GCM10009756_22840 [Pseudokineococcus marinus]
MASSPVGGIFAETSVWRQDISHAPLHPDSAAMSANVAKQVKDHWGGVAAFNVYKFGTSVYTVPSTQKRVDVKFDDCQKKGYVPSGLYGDGGQFVSVPIPSNAVPAAGTDGQLTIYSPGTDQLWEFWKASKKADGWHACWGGRIDTVSTSAGQFKDHFGASASGLAVTAGSIRINEAKTGVINHALSLQLIAPKHYKTVSWPAVRSDGWSTSASAVPQGQRLRLDPTVNVDALKLTPVAKAVAKAAQKYGFIVTDTAGAVAVQAEAGDGVAAVTGSNPWYGILGGTPSYAVMKNFPWDKIQVLPDHYGKPGTETAPAGPTCNA